MVSKLLAVAVLVGSVPASAEPCAILTLQPELLGPTSTEVTADGGVLAGLVPKMESKATDFSGWVVVGKPSIGMATIAPGLFVIKPPLDAATFEVRDAKNKKRATAKVVAKPAAKLVAPVLQTVVSGATKSKHVSQFVTVTLKDPAPPGARAMVLFEASTIGGGMSWGITTDGATEVSVYNTQGGCVTAFPDGTVKAQPKDQVRAYWIDNYGRRSPSSAAVVVGNP